MKIHLNICNGGKCECGGTIQQSTYADWCDSCDFYFYYG